MSGLNGSSETKLEMPESVREWFRAIRRLGKGGWASWPAERHRIVAQLTLKQAWRTRRERYGKSGRRADWKPKPYVEWCKDHNYQINDNGEIQ